MAAAIRAMPACRWLTRPPSARVRSIQPVSAEPSITAGSASSSSTKLLLVLPPSMITMVSATARRSRASASSRSAPKAMILAIIESKSAGITSPVLNPVSTRTPGPAGSCSSWIRPGAGAKSRSGSSAFNRASTAWPASAGRSPSSLPPAAMCSWALTRSRPVVSSVIGCSTCSRVLTSRNANSFDRGW